MIISLVGQKGGSGKSTLAICMAVELLTRGRTVLLVDCDPQRTAVTWQEVAAEKGHPAPSVIAMTGTLHRDNQLPMVAKGYADVIIDTPPRGGDVQRSALMVSDIALMPCGPSAPEAWSLANSILTVKEATEYRPKLKSAIVINKKRARTLAALGARDALEQTGMHVFRTELGYRQAFQDAIAEGLGVTAFAPRDASTIELRALVDELETYAKNKTTRRK